MNRIFVVSPRELFHVFEETEEQDPDQFDCSNDQDFQKAAAEARKEYEAKVEQAAREYEEKIGSLKAAAENAWKKTVEARRRLQEVRPGEEDAQASLEELLKRIAASYGDDVEQSLEKFLDCLNKARGGQIL